MHIEYCQVQVTSNPFSLLIYPVISCTPPPTLQHPPCPLSSSFPLPPIPIYSPCLPLVLYFTCRKGFQCTCTSLYVHLTINLTNWFFFLIKFHINSPFITSSFCDDLHSPFHSLTHLLITPHLFLAAILFVLQSWRRNRPFPFSDVAWHTEFLQFFFAPDSQISSLSCLHFTAENYYVFLTSASISKLLAGVHALSMWPCLEIEQRNFQTGCLLCALYRPPFASDLHGWSAFALG